MAFCVPTLMKLINAQKYHVYIYYTIFHSNQTINVEMYGQKFIYTSEHCFHYASLGLLTLENDSDLFLQRGSKAVNGLNCVLINVGKVLVKPEKSTYSYQVQCMRVLVIAPG